MEDDEYYDKYKSEDTGYGIYLDKNLNVEYRYFTLGTFYDFKDAKDEDRIKREIYSLLDETDIWLSNDSQDDVVNEEKADKIIKSREGTFPECGHSVNKNTKNQVAIKCCECGHTFLKKNNIWKYPQNSLIIKHQQFFNISQKF